MNRINFVLFGFAVIALLLLSVTSIFVSSKKNKDVGPIVKESGSLQVVPNIDMEKVASNPSLIKPTVEVGAPQALTLTVTSPTDNGTVSQKQVTVKGKTNSQAILVINGMETDVATDGTFSKVVSLTAGMNSISILAKDDKGNYNLKNVKVRYNP